MDIYKQMFNSQTEILKLIDVTNFPYEGKSSVHQQPEKELQYTNKYF